MLKKLRKITAALEARLDPVAAATRTISKSITVLDNHIQAASWSRDRGAAAVEKACAKHTATVDRLTRHHTAQVDRLRIRNMNIDASMERAARIKEKLADLIS